MLNVTGASPTSATLKTADRLLQIPLSVLVVVDYSCAVIYQIMSENSFTISGRLHRLTKSTEST